jgi:hypothetical protein
MIHIPAYEVLCAHCRWVIAAVPSLDEAQEIEHTGRDCIVVDGAVYCCEECAEKGRAVA